MNRILSIILLWITLPGLNFWIAYERYFPIQYRHTEYKMVSISDNIEELFSEFCLPFCLENFQTYCYLCIYLDCTIENLCEEMWEMRFSDSWVSWREICFKQVLKSSTQNGSRRCRFPSGLGGQQAVLWMVETGRNWPVLPFLLETDKWDRHKMDGNT